MHVLQRDPSKDDTAWNFIVPPDALRPPKRQSEGTVYGKFIKFTHEEISIGVEKFPSNRILHSDDPTKFILLSFGNLRFKDTPIRATGEYIARLLKDGILLNGIRYRFYHHSNSQLVCCVQRFPALLPLYALIARPKLLPPGG